MTFQSNDNGKNSKRGWVDKNNHYERYYCEICNVWMASDKASILTHRNGKKHLDNTRSAQSLKLITTAAQEKQQSALEVSLRQMESAAYQSAQQDYGLFAGAVAPATNQWDTSQSVSDAAATQYVPRDTSNNTIQSALITNSSEIPNQPNVKQERKEWDDRKKQRDSTKQKDQNDKGVNYDDESAPSYKRQKLTIGENDGYYSNDDTIVWLEAVVFGEILEEDLPIQIWLGNTSATENELKMAENQRHWKDGMVVATHLPQLSDSYADRIVVDVAYLENPDDTEEHLKKSVRLKHIRIMLGNNADDRIPSTLEEARVLAMGGEAIQPTHLESAVPEIDESTGLSGWSTIRIKRTTLRNELKTERELLRKERRNAASRAEKKAKDVEMRRMEEAKTCNADDSALGAYDIWGRTKDGYKGVQIHTTVSSNSSSVSVHDYGKKLAANGVSTSFKSRTTNKSAVEKKRQNRRTTSADDD